MWYKDLFRRPSTFLEASILRWMRSTEYTLVIWCGYVPECLHIGESSKTDVVSIKCRRITEQLTLGICLLLQGSSADESEFLAGLHELLVLGFVG